VRSDDLATCISCGLCLNDCPTYRVLGDEADSPRGRVQLIRQMVSTDGPPPELLAGHLEACLVCRACETACPSGVPFGRIMEGAREDLRARERPRRVARLVRRIGLATVTSQPRLRLATRLLDLYARSGAPRLAGLLPKGLRSMASLAMQAEGVPYVPVERSDADTAFFAGCIMRTAFGETERATVRMLERDGRRVSACAEQTCCGALHAHAGDGETARELARLNIDAFAGATGPIVVNAAGCGAQLKAYGDLLADDAAWADRAREFGARVRDASQAVRPDSVGAHPPRPVRVVYQDACHLAHGQKIRREPRALLAGMPNVTLAPIADAERCCGSAGVYNLTHPGMADAQLAGKLDAIAQTHADVVVVSNPGCLLHMARGAKARGMTTRMAHLVDVLGAAYPAGAGATGPARVPAAAPGASPPPTATARGPAAS